MYMIIFLQDIGLPGFMGMGIGMGVYGRRAASLNSNISHGRRTVSCRTLKDILSSFGNTSTHNSQIFYLWNFPRPVANVDTSAAFSIIRMAYNIIVWKF